MTYFRDLARGMGEPATDFLRGRKSGLVSAAERLATERGMCLTGSAPGVVCSRGGIGCPVPHDRVIVVEREEPEAF